MKDKAPKQDYAPDIHHVIELAWRDEVSFDDIHTQTGLSEPQVIAVMRGHMKPSSFRMWRKRVSGRKTKHDKTKHDKTKHQAKSAKWRYDPLDNRLDNSLDDVARD